MAVERANSGSSLIDVLDRVLDKGIVIDAWVRVSLVGIDLITVEARVVVASIETYLRFSEAVSGSLPVARPALADGRADGPSYAQLLSENSRLKSQLRSPRPRQSVASQRRAGSRAS
jgi:hypothetical protein